MYYITNHNDQIIAADESLLHLLQVEDIDELIKKVLLEEISFRKPSSTELQIVTPTETYTYAIQLVSLTSMLGSLKLVDLETIKEETDDTSSLILPSAALGGASLVAGSVQQSEEEPLTIVEPEDNTLTIDDNSEDELFELDTKEEQSETIQVTKESDDTLTTSTEGEEVFDLSLPNETISNDDISLNDTETTHTIDDGELFDLSLPVTPKHSIDDIGLNSGEDETELSTSNESLDTSPIIIDIKDVSEDIGISEEDYKTFLNDYIDTAISLEDELQSEDENERLSAMGTLTQLADVLQLPKVNAIIQNISIVPKDELSTLVETFYQTLARLTTKETSKESVDSIEKTSSEVEDKPLYTEPKVMSNKNGFGKIYLEDVKPIHFDFQLESAANDLSLPVELIEEFVHDFIEQGHIETKKMLQAYEEGDLDTIQKIGHLLKGASSNLRINALSDTLYDIQFCEDSDKLEELIERYWAHFISFEQQIDIITKQGQ